MKKKNVLLKVVVILIIIMVSLISFLGIYKRNLNSWENILPDYNFGKDLGEMSIFGLRVDKSTKEVEDDTALNDENTTQDNENATQDNETESSTEQTTEGDNPKETTKPTKEVPVNDPTVLKTENYKKSKEIIEQRLKKFNIVDSTVSLNEENGEISVSVPYGENINNVPELVSMQGKVEIIDTETKEVLIDGKMIDKATMYYVPKDESNSANNNVQTYEFGVRLEFNSEGKKKLNEISKKYIETINEEGETEQKTITTRIDGENKDTTYFPANYSYTYLPVRIQSSVTVTDGDMTEFREKYSETYVYQVAINSGEMPVVYNVVPGAYFSNNAGENYIRNIAIIIAVILAVISIVMIIKFKKKGIIATLIEIGYIAIVLLLIRAANVDITLAGLTMILFMSALNDLLLVMLMNKEKLNKFAKFTLNMIPFIITILVFNFSTDINLESVGMIGVWGILTFAYTFITSIILLDNKNAEKNGVEKNEE